MGHPHSISPPLEGMVPFSGTADLQIALLASSNWISCLVSVRVRWGAPARVVRSSSLATIIAIITISVVFWESVRAPRAARARAAARSGTI